MSDLRLEVEGNEFSLEAVSHNGLYWLIQDSEDAYGIGTFKVPEIGEKIYFPLNTQDIVVHQVQDLGLVVSF